METFVGNLCIHFCLPFYTPIPSTAMDSVLYSTQISRALHLIPTNYTYSNIYCITSYYILLHISALFFYPQVEFNNKVNYMPLYISIHIIFKCTVLIVLGVGEITPNATT
jgi:hypothetical protein